MNAPLDGAASSGQGAVHVDELPWTTRWQMLLRTLAPVHNAHGHGQLLDWLAQPATPTVVAFANAHAFNTAAVDHAFFRRLLSADLVLRDGIGMALLLVLMNQRPGLNLNGTDLIPRVMRRYAGTSIALFGTADPWLTRAREVVEARYAPRASFVTAHGFLPTQDYVRLACAFRPRLIVLGMGMPRQEEVALALRAALWEPCLIVCGGAILDFMGGRVPRAPQGLRRAGLEWAWRLAREPRRLFGRYVLGNPAFIGRAVTLAVRSVWEERTGRRMA